MAVPIKDVTEEKSPYTVNKPLFDEATAIKTQLRMMEERLAKMEEHRKDVSESVYLKVKSDYRVQIDGIRGNFQAKCQEVNRELEQLYAAQKEQQAEVEAHQEVLEEARFRHVLGEYTDKKFKELESKENKDITRFSEILGTIQNSIRQYEEILGEPFKPGAAFEKPKEISKPAAPTPAKPKEAPPARPTLVEENTARTMEDREGPTGKTAVPPASAAAASSEAGRLGEDLDMFLNTEGDYFTQDSEEIVQQNEVEIEESISATVEPVPEKAKPVAPAPVSKTKPDDDSISSILRDIPYDDTDQGATKVAEESTGAKVDLSGYQPEASMLLIEGDLDEHEFVLGESTTIGRSPSNDIVLKETKVSRQHAHINFQDGNYIIIDLKSSNGIFVNGKRVEEAILSDGDEVAVGSFKFQFNLS